MSDLPHDLANGRMAFGVNPSRSQVEQFVINNTVIIGSSELPGQHVQLHSIRNTVYYQRDWLRRPSQTAIIGTYSGLTDRVLSRRRL